MKYLCNVCGQIVTPDEDGNCPICGAGPEALEEQEESDE